MDVKNELVVVIFWEWMVLSEGLTLRDGFVRVELDSTQNYKIRVCLGSIGLPAFNSSL